MKSIIKKITSVLLICSIVNANISCSKPNIQRILTNPYLDHSYGINKAKTGDGNSSSDSGSSDSGDSSDSSSDGSGDDGDSGNDSGDSSADSGAKGTVNSPANYPDNYNCDVYEDKTGNTTSYIWSDAGGDSDSNNNPQDKSTEEPTTSNANTDKLIDLERHAKELNLYLEKYKQERDAFYAELEKSCKGSGACGDVEFPSDSEDKIGTNGKANSDHKPEPGSNSAAQAKNIRQLNEIPEIKAAIKLRDESLKALAVSIEQKEIRKIEYNKVQDQIATEKKNQALVQQEMQKELLEKFTNPKNKFIQNSVQINNFNTKIKQTISSKILAHNEKTKAFATLMPQTTKDANPSPKSSSPAANRQNHSFKTLPGTPEFQKLQDTQAYANQAKLEINTHKFYQIEKQNLLIGANIFIQVADYSYANNFNTEGNIYIEYAKSAIDLALSFVPGVGFTKDLISIISGNNIITGEKLTTLQRAVLAGSLFLPAVISGGVKTFKKLKTILTPAAKNIPEVQKILADLAKLGQKEQQLVEKILQAKVELPPANQIENIAARLDLFNGDYVIRNAAEVNAEAIALGFKPPYASGIVAEGKVVDTTFYRATSGEKFDGRWVVDFNPKSMTKTEFADKFALPNSNELTDISNVITHNKPLIRIGEVAPQPEWCGKGGGLQIELLDKFYDNNLFTWSRGEKW